ncbi:MAG: GNAT family N-acetyltransferase [Actinomycetota bacterium]
MSDLADVALRDVRTLLARAYTDDPLMVWIFPDERSRPDAVAAWLGLFVEHYLNYGHVDTVATDRLEAVAVWRMPDQPAPGAVADSRPTLPTVPGLLTAMVGAERASAIGDGLATIRELTPEQPYAYLQFLAVDPDLRRRGRGRQVLEAGLRRAGRSEVGVHLETMNEENLGFYRRLGFEVSGERQLAPDGPTTWAMWADPAGLPG